MYKKLKAAGIEENYSFDSFPYYRGKDYNRLIMWTNGDLDYRGVVLTGPGGSGKTGLAISATRDRMLQGDSVWFERWENTFRRFWAAHWREEDKALLERICNLDFLAIDEIQIQTNPWGMRLLHSLIRKSKRIIVTAVKIPNYLSKDLKDFLWLNSNEGR